MDNFESAAKDIVQWWTPLVEASFGFICVVFQVVIRAPEAVAISLSVPVLIAVIVLSWRHRREVKRLNAERCQQDDPDVMEMSM